MKLGFGPGAGARLLAPGSPDWIGTDGTRLGWIVRDHLYLLRDGVVTALDLTDEGLDATASPTHWTVALDRGFVLVDPEAGELVGGLFEDDREPLRLVPGADVGVVLGVPEHQLVRLHDGRALPLPDGAIRSRWLAPWARGPGACWVDLDTLYRLGPRISALASVPGCDGIAVGPEGAVLVSREDSSVVAAARGVAVEVHERLSTEFARFSPDGRQLLAVAEDGVVLVDLAAGTVLRRFAGNAQPVGFAPGPWRLDVDRGEVLDEADAVVAGGFRGPAPGVGGDWIAGPGGRVWTRTGEPVRDGLPEGVAATDGRRVVVVDETMLWLDGVVVPHGLCADDDAIRRVRLRGDEIVVETLDGEEGVFDTQGALQRRRRVEPDADAHAAFPLAGDGAVVHEGTQLVWTEEGMLARLVPSP